MLSIIAIIGKNRELGKDNKLLWNIPSDLKRFKQITKGHPVIMGRKTFQSIGYSLPDRPNIVISSNPSFLAEGATIVRSLNEALAFAKKLPGNDEIFIIGGGNVYAQTINQANRIYLTIVDTTALADIYFPDYSRFTKIIFQQAHNEEGYTFTYFVLEP